MKARSPFRCAVAALAFVLIAGPAGAFFGGGGGIKEGDHAVITSYSIHYTKLYDQKSRTTTFFPLSWA